MFTLGFCSTGERLPVALRIYKRQRVNLKFSGSQLHIVQVDNSYCVYNYVINYVIMQDKCLLF